MAQGKLHSSPFHIETSNYKYAIEHESDEYKRGTFLINCQYLVPSTNHCTLWNSGRSKSCAQFGCNYLTQHEHLKPLSCIPCAYCFENRCFSPKRPQDFPIQLSEASYCCYFLKEKTDTELFQRIRKYCKRLYYTEQLIACQNEISAIKNEIQVKQLNIDISRNTTSESRLEHQETSKLTALTEKLHQLTTQLNMLGGKLDIFPHIKKNKKKKANTR